MSTSLEVAAPPRRHLPGDLAMWFFILAELSVFAVLILAFAVTQVLKPQLFAAGRQLLDTSTGLAMTLSLLVLLLAVAKAWLITEGFMELRHAPRLWRRLLLGWPLVVALLLGVSLSLRG